MGIATYMGLIHGAYVSGGKGLSLSSFVLWTALSLVSAIGIVRRSTKTDKPKNVKDAEEKGSPSIPAIYGSGALIVSVILWQKGAAVTWSSMDTLIAILVCACIALLFKKKFDKHALVLSVLAGTIAGIPYTVMTWQNPAASPIVCSVCFFSSSFLAFLGAEGWTLKSRLFTGVSVVNNLILIIPWLIWRMCLR